MSSPIKVAILVPTLKVGGAEVLILEEMRALANDDRVDFEIIMAFEEGPLYEQVKATGVPIKVFHGKHSPWSNLKTYFNIVRYLRKRRFDIVHIHMIHHGAVLGKLAGVPRVITTIHNYRTYSKLEKLFFRLNDELIGCGSKVTELMNMLYPGKKVTNISNGIATIPPAAELDPSIPISRDPNDVIAVSVGRLTRQKGFDILIDAMHAAAQSQPNLKLYIAGEGELQEDLQNKIDTLGLARNVTLLGRITTIPALLNKADIYVNSSLWEGLPMTLLEAMRAALPIVATDIDGNRTVITDQVNGVMVESGKADGLAQALNALASDAQGRKKLGQNAYAVFERDYTIEKHCEKLLEVYRGT